MAMMILMLLMVSGMIFGFFLFAVPVSNWRDSVEKNQFRNEVIMPKHQETGVRHLETNETGVKETPLPELNFQNEKYEQALVKHTNLNDKYMNGIYITDEDEEYEEWLQEQAQEADTEQPTTETFVASDESTAPKQGKPEIEMSFIEQSPVNNDPLMQSIFMQQEPMKQPEVISQPNETTSVLSQQAIDNMADIFVQDMGMDAIFQTAAVQPTSPEASSFVVPEPIVVPMPIVEPSQIPMDNSTNNSSPAFPPEPTVLPQNTNSASLFDESFIF